MLPRHVSPNPSQLPTELWTHIFQQLTCYEEWLLIRAVCRCWYSIVAKQVTQLPRCHPNIVCYGAFMGSQTIILLHDNCHKLLQGAMNSALTGNRLDMVLLIYAYYDETVFNDVSIKLIRSRNDSILNEWLIAHCPNLEQHLVMAESSKQLVSTIINFIPNLHCRIGRRRWRRRSSSHPSCVKRSRYPALSTSQSRAKIR